MMTDPTTSIIIDSNRTFTLTAEIRSQTRRSTHSQLTVSSANEQTRTTSTSPHPYQSTHPGEPGQETWNWDTSGPKRTPTSACLGRSRRIEDEDRQGSHLQICRNSQFQLSNIHAAIELPRYQTGPEGVTYVLSCVSVPPTRKPPGLLDFTKKSAQADLIQLSRNDFQSFRQPSPVIPYAIRKLIGAGASGEAYMVQSKTSSGAFS